MIKRLLLFFSLVVSLEAFCQDYSLVNTGKTYFFQYRHYSNVDLTDAIRIDSFTVNGSDSIFFNFKKFGPNLLDQTGTCARTLQHIGSMGIQTIKYSNGDFCFLNSDTDSVFIRSSALINDTWTMYRFINGNTIEATLSNISVAGFIGLTDTVKTVTLQARDILQNPVAHPFNNKTISFSRNYGLVKTVNLLTFPSDTLTYDIYGQTNPVAGQQNLTARDIFNFNVGDIFHFLHEQNALSHQYDIYTRLKVLSKYVSVNQDTIIYLDSSYQVVVETDTATTTRTLLYDSIISDQYIISEFQKFEKLPEEPAFPLTAFQNGSYQQGYSPVLNRRFKRISPYEEYYRYSDSCWNDPIIDGYPCWYEFYEGLGRGNGPGFYNTDCQFMFYNSSFQVLYYQQGADIWGSPVNFDSLLSSTFDLGDSNPQISFYPNPFTTSVQLHFETPVSGHRFILLLFDVLGKEVLRIPDIHSDIVIERNNLARGVYSYSLTSEKQAATTGKLIVY